MSISTYEEKSRIALRNNLIGKEWYECVAILHYGETLHTGTRKNGITPEFAHQIWIANFILNLDLPDVTMRLAISIALLHDTSEDKSISFEELENKYGYEIAHGVQLLTKKFRGIALPTDVYFDGLVTMAAAAIVKGVDRLHNLYTMIGAFPLPKMHSYIIDSREKHLPMLKKAKQLYPEFTKAFQNIKMAITLVIDTLEKTLPSLPQE